MTELYRHFDAQGRLLYVGISVCAFARLVQHRARAPWFDRIATITIERHGTEQQARKAERTAIRTERPQFNVTTNSGIVRIGGIEMGRDELAIVAEKAGTTLGYLSEQVANGHRKPSPELAKKLAAASGNRLKLSDLRPDLWGRAA